MREIRLARIDGKTRPVLILTRDSMRGRLTKVTVAPVTSTIRGLAIEVPVGAANGLDHQSVVNCDNVATLRVAEVGRPIGFLLESQEPDLAAALAAAFDLAEFG